MTQIYVLVLTLFMQGGQGWSEGGNALAIQRIDGLSEARCRAMANEWVTHVRGWSKRIQASAICMPVGNPSTDVKPLT